MSHQIQEQPLSWCYHTFGQTSDKLRIISNLLIYLIAVLALSIYLHFLHSCNTILCFLSLFVPPIGLLYGLIVPCVVWFGCQTKLFTES